ncbi:MAG: hypothetical protein LBQ79_02390, partial [Deltaproteobacteria bacterium]|nr:hypothetical protein [Deltaproteobacteria bacterium]
QRGTEGNRGEQRGTEWNRGEQSGTEWNRGEQSGTEGNRVEQSGTEGEDEGTGGKPTNGGVGSGRDLRIQLGIVFAK